MTLIPGPNIFQGFEIRSWNHDLLAALQSLPQTCHLAVDLFQLGIQTAWNLRLHPRHVLATLNSQSLKFHFQTVQSLLGILLCLLQGDDFRDAGGQQSACLVIVLAHCLVFPIPLLQAFDQLFLLLPGAAKLIENHLDSFSGFLPPRVTRIPEEN